MKCKDTRPPKQEAFCAGCGKELRDKRAEPGSRCFDCRLKK